MPESEAQNTAPGQEDAVVDQAASEAAPPGEPGQAPPSEEDALHGELEAARDRALRAQADLENYRKRAQREMGDTRRYAALPLLRDLLPLTDNIRLAIQAAEKTEDAAGLLEGFKMLAQQMDAVLKQHDCSEIIAGGEPIDPELHEAAVSQPSTDHAPGTVISVLRRGYRVHDRVVRPAQVVVSVEPPLETPEAEDDEESQ